MAAMTGVGRRLTTAFVVVLVLGGCVWWGLHPPRDEPTYRQTSADTIELLQSDVETVRLWIVAMDAGKVTSAAAEVALTEAETDAASRLSRFAAYQPPNESASGVRHSVTSAGDDVKSLLADIRVDARAGRWDAAIATKGKLVDISKRLRDLERQVSP